MTSVRLPLLPRREAELTTCAYCPKLCRAACPVADVEASETLTPWGKMSLAWFAARGSVPLSESVAASAFACTGCLACQARCDHKNPVALTLLEARAAVRAAGFGHEAAERIDLEEVAARRAAGLRALAEREGVDPGARTALLLGTAYLTRELDAARAAIAVVSRLLGPVRLLHASGGEVERGVGMRAEADAAEAALLSEAAGLRVIVLDPGCMTSALRAAGALTVVELVAERLAELTPVPALATGVWRWHDPCRLGRGLGVYDEPRAILTRLTGRPPLEFSRAREAAVCSGAGGLLPITMPEASRGIAEARLGDHERLGGGTVVTACASSVRRFRASGAAVVDLVELVAQGLPAGRPLPTQGQ
ncbi:MAG: (Fe-S)-binding protein [Polyangiaceae bacterium]|nr:(Fe-S)-binding protein [Polyangiaceae bacterium]MCW5792220.1 (Fe-S)-binding protein [Polyangiaceae bacterium]